VALAAPTLELLGEASGGFHFHGYSSKGKTKILAVSASVFGFPMMTWRTTDNALENTAERHNSVLLALDELSQIDPRRAVDTAYTLGNEQSKERMTQSTGAQKQKHWKLLFLSTGEITFADHVEAGGSKIKAGSEVRMVNLEADAGVDMGVFENIHGLEKPSDFADMLEQNATAFRGVAGPLFVKYLIDNEPSAIDYLKQKIAAFANQAVPAGSSGEIHRVAKRFGIVAAAGELATEAGITGWTPGMAMDAAEWCFKRWLSGRSLGASDLEKAIDHLRGFLIQNSNRFEDLTEADGWLCNSVPNRAGFRRKVDGGEMEYLIFPEVFKSELKGYDPTSVARELEKRGHLVRGKNRLQVQVRIPGMDKAAPRFYAVRSSIFGEEDDESSDVATVPSDV
jgi:uncharacterized protein (DUF927 family)